MRTSAGSMDDRSIDGIVKEARSLWDKRFHKHMTPESHHIFSQDLDKISKEYPKDTKDYIGILNIVFENYSSFLMLTEGAEVNKTGGYSFRMRDLFYDLYVIVTREFVEERLKGKVKLVKSYDQIRGNSQLLIINPIHSQFELVNGTTKKTQYVIGEGSVSHKIPKVSKVIVFDNQGKVISTKDCAAKSQIYDRDTEEKLVYKVISKLN